MVLNKNLLKKGWLILFVFFFGYCNAQIQDKGIPHSFYELGKHAVIIPEVKLDSVRAEQLKTEENQRGIPNRFAVVQYVNVDVIEAGIKTEVEGGCIWRYQVNSPDAVSLGVIFETFDLPEGAELYIYNPDKSKVLGAFTSQNNKSGNRFPLSQFRGNQAVLEYFEPEGVEFQGVLKIGSILQGYKELESAVASTTRIGVNCTEGDDWQNQKRSVCLMSFVEGIYGYYCTGFLVNNTKENGIPYFMTANHCISSEDVASTLVTYFNYEDSSCDEDDAEKNQSLSGATLKATNSYSDFTLLELSEYPPDEYNAFYAGWDASGDQSEGGTCIHHPNGQPKCISISDGAPESYNHNVFWSDNTVSKVNTHWEVYFSQGNTESGSSGSPLFDQDGRVVGQLHGGDDYSSLYGKFSLSWDYSSTQSKQLSYWLDPSQNGTLQLDGMDIKIPPLAGFFSEVSFTCLETPVTLYDESNGILSSWLWKIEPNSFTFAENTDSTSQNPVVYFEEEGLYTISLIVSNSNGSDTVIVKNAIEAVSSISVEINDMPEEITLCGCDLDNYVLTVDGADSYEFKIEEEGRFNTSVADAGIELTLSDDYLKQPSFDTYISVTGILGNCSDSDSILLHVVIPENDYIENAARLNPGTNAIYSNVCASVEDSEPYPSSNGCLLENNWCPADTVLNHSVWFTFVGPSSGNISIAAEGFDTQIAVYEADDYSSIVSSSANYSLLAANDNSSNSDYSSYIENLAVEKGKVYWLQLDGYGGETGEATITLLANSLEVYPNPTTGEFYVTISSMEGAEATIEVYSLDGKLHVLKNVSISNESNTFNCDLAGLVNGLYIVRATVDGVPMNRKLMLVR